MQSELFNRYSFDECKNEKKLFESLKKLQSDGKITWSKEDQFVFKIKDIELSESDIDKLTELFDSLDVFPYLEELEELESEDDWNDWDEQDEDSDYKPGKKSRDDWDEDY
jgi:hypothetical protein